MGDTVEFTTSSSIVHSKLHTFYAINSNASAVRVKSAQAVLIRLTETPSSKLEPLYEIHIGCNNNTISNIKKNANGSIKATANTPDILSDIAFRGFSIKFVNNKISVCRETALTPFLECTDEMLPSFKFISFENSDQNWFVGRGQNLPTTAYWMFEVPPAVKTPVLGPLKCGEVRWEKVIDGKLPPDAFIGAVDECPIYVARAEHRRTITPGLYAEVLPHALISWGGHAHPKDDFEVLCGYNVSWQPTSGDKPIPPNAIPGGYEDGFTLFIVRASWEGHVRVGKMHPRWHLGYISYKRREIELPSFEILVKHRPTVNDVTTVNRYETDEEEEHGPDYEYAF